MRALFLQSPLLLPAVTGQQKRWIFTSVADILEDATVEAANAMSGADLCIQLQGKTFLPWLSACFLPASLTSAAFGDFRAGALRLAAMIDCDGVVSMLVDQFLPRLQVSLGADD